MEFRVKKARVILGLIMTILGLCILIATVTVAKYNHPYLWFYSLRTQYYFPMIFSGGVLIVGGIIQYFTRKRMKIEVTSTGINYIGPISYMDKFIPYSDYRIREVDGRKLQELKLPYGTVDFDNRDELFNQIGHHGELYLKERGLLIDRPL